MPPIPLTEAELKALVRQAQEGSAEAFGKVYDHYFLQVYRYSAFRLPAEIAEDIVADVFVKAWEKLSTYKDQQDIPFGAWLFRIARHTVIDAYRTQRGFEEVSETLPDPDVYNRAESAFERKETLRIVRKAMDGLPARYREVLVLSFIGELPHSDIARVLRMTEGGVRILKLRALRKLEGLLPPEIAERA
ncbi:MAG: sigma-70 family RNA polymerase sigma factor [Candidatus Peregrinibacteria bacterium]|nr:sigma-70 family RNA polymerase sigma factor [Candidatus Peregrinibacteria bacterium]